MDWYVTNRSRVVLNEVEVNSGVDKIGVYFLALETVDSRLDLGVLTVEWVTEE